MFNAAIFTSRGSSPIAPTGTPTLSNFRIENAEPSRVYFDSSSSISGMTATGFVISGKTISSVSVNGTNTTGHYFTVTEPFTFWDNNTIRLESGDGTVHDFTMEYIVNNIVEPTASGSVRYVTTTASGSADGTTEGNAWTIEQAISGASAGMTIYVKAGLYSSKQLDFRKVGTVDNPIKWIGYKTTTGDITSNYWDFDIAWSDTEMPTLTGTTSTAYTYMFRFRDSEYVIMKNFQFRNGSKGIDNFGFCRNVVVENINTTDMGSTSYEGVGVTFSNTTYSSTNLHHIRVKNSVLTNAGSHNLYIMGAGFNLVDNVKTYSDFPSTPLHTDYHIAIAGDNNIVRNSYAESIQATISSIHGIGLRNSTFPSSEYNLIEGCEAVNVEEGFYFRNIGAANSVVKNCSFRNNASGTDKLERGGVSFYGCGNNNTVENLFVDDAGYGITFRDDVGDSGDDGIRSVGTGHVLKNVIVKNSTYALHFTGGVNDDTVNANNSIINSTFSDCDNFLYESENTLVTSNFSIKNSIINNIPALGTNLNGIIFDYTNIYNSWATTLGTNSSNINPNFVDLVDFVPQGAIQLAPRLAGVNYDYNGKERDNPTTIGAVTLVSESVGEVTPPITYTPDYYVSSSTGDDNNDGLTEQTAWATMTKVNTFISGLSYTTSAVIAFKTGDEWNSRLVINEKAQAPNGAIVITSYGSGNSPIINVMDTQTLTWTDVGGNIWRTPNTAQPVVRMQIDGEEVLNATAYAQLGINVSGTGTDPRSVVTFYNDSANDYLYVYSADSPSNHTIKYTSFPNGQVVYIGYSSNVIVHGLELIGGYYAGIGIYGSQDVTIQNCTLGELTGSTGIEIEKTMLARSENFIIENNIIDTKFTIDYSGANETEHNSCDGIAVWDGLNGVIRNNFVKNWGHSGIQLLGNEDTKFIENVDVYGNTVTAPDIAYGAGLGVGIQSRYCEVYNNLHVDGAGASTHGGYRNHFHNNIYLRTRTSPIKPWQTGFGFRIQGTHFYPFYGLMQENIIENNTVIDCESGGLAISGNNYNNTVTLNIYRNNIFYNNGSTFYNNQISIDFDYNEYGDADGNIFQNNLLYSSETRDVVYYYQNLLSVEEFNAQNGMHSHTITNNMYGDPMFLSNSDFRLQNTSPAIGTGITALTTLDRNGNVIPYPGTGVDLGAYESPYPDSQPPAEETLTYGAELITNGDFTGTWTTSGTYSTVPPGWITTGSPNTDTSNVSKVNTDEVRIISSVEDGPWIYQSGVVEIGETYGITIVISSISNGWLKVTGSSVNEDYMKISAPGTYFSRVTIPSAVGIVLRAQGVGIDVVIQSISIKKL